MTHLHIQLSSRNLRNSLLYPILLSLQIVYAQSVSQTPPTRHRATNKELMAIRLEKCVWSPSLSADGRYLAYSFAHDKELLVRSLDEVKSPVVRLTPIGTAAASAAWSCDGKFLAYRFTEKSGDHNVTTVKVWDRATGNVNTIGSCTGETWSPKGHDLAFIKPDSEGKPGRLNIWNGDSSQVKEYAVSGENPIWAFNGKRIFLVRHFPFKQIPDSAIAPGKVLVAEVGIKIFQTEPEKIARGKIEGATPGRSGQAIWHPAETRHSSRLDIVCVDIGSAAAADVMHIPDNAKFAPSPDGTHVVAWRGPNERTDLTYSVYLGSVPLANTTLNLETTVRIASEQGGDWVDATGKQLPVIVRNEPGIFGHGSWSPDSSSFAFTNHRTTYLDKMPKESSNKNTGDIFVVNALKATIRNLTKRVDFSHSLRRRWVGRLGYDTYFYPRFGGDDHGRGGSPAWTLNGRFIICGGELDLWRVNAVSGEALNLTAQFPDGASLIDPLDARKFVDNSITLIKTSESEETRTLVQLSLTTGRVIQSGKVFKTGQIPISDQNGICLFTDQDYDRFPDYYATSDFRVNAFPTRLLIDQKSLTADFEFPKLRRLRWKTKFGIVQGALWLPVSAESGTRPPTILAAYPSPKGLSFDFFSLNPGVEYDVLDLDAINKLTAHGYAVFWAEVPVGDDGVWPQGGVLKEVTSGVLLALDAVEATGLIDPLRVGIYGHSYGGYMVNCVVTQTDRFCAAVSAASMSDLYSSAFTAIVGFELVTGQERMGATPYEAPDRYRMDSPVTYLQNVTTPLMLFDGEDDPRCPISQSEEMYGGLDALGKAAVLVRFKSGGHTAHCQDWEFIMNFFDRYLKPQTNPTKE